MRRTLDIILLILACPIFIPLIFLASLAKLIVDGRPIFYLSTRLGRKRVPFLVFKFRTMVTDRSFIEGEIRSYSSQGFEAIPLCSPVYTSLGRLFEKSQLVEIPQLFNIAIGSMSFVGCRPLPFSHYQALKINFGENLVNQRFEQMVGLTGLAQLHSKFSLTPEMRLSIELNEGKFYESNIWVAYKICLYFYSLFGTVLYILIGRAPFVEIVYRWMLELNERSSRVSL